MKAASNEGCRILGPKVLSVLFANGLEKGCTAEELLATRHELEALHPTYMP
jgi:hypothetical protein